MLIVLLTNKTHDGWLQATTGYGCLVVLFNAAVGQLKVPCCVNIDETAVHSCTLTGCFVFFYFIFGLYTPYPQAEGVSDHYPVEFQLQGIENSLHTLSYRVILAGYTQHNVLVIMYIF